MLYSAFPVTYSLVCCREPLIILPLWEYRYPALIFNRPGFQQMIADMENGEIGCVITKDLSRLGRNQLHTGLYIEERFPMFGVRYIAINDIVDTENAESNDLMPFKNLFNVLFCFSTVFANGVKAHSIAKAPVTVSLRERRLQVLAFASFG